MLDSLEKAVLVAIDRVTKETRRPTEADAVYEERERMGQMPKDALFLYDLAGRLRDDGHLDAYFAGGMTVGQLKLTREGREVARADIDPMEQVYSEVRRLFASDEFAAAYPAAFPRSGRAILKGRGTRAVPGAIHDLRDAYPASPRPPDPTPSRA